MTSFICSARMPGSDRRRCVLMAGHGDEHRNGRWWWWSSFPPPDPSTWFADALAYPKANT